MEFKIRILAALIMVFLSGCRGPFVPVQSLEKVGISTVLAANNIKVVSENEAKNMILIGSFSGHSCQNRAFVSEPASTKVGAVDQLKITAAQNGAKSISEPKCEKGGFSLIKNCYNSWECKAFAYR